MGSCHVGASTPAHLCGPLWSILVPFEKEPSKMELVELAQQRGDPPVGGRMDGVADVREDHLDDMVGQVVDVACGAGE